MTEKISKWLQQWELYVLRKAVMFGHWDDVAVLYPRVGSLIPKPLFRVLVASQRKENVVENITLSEETVALVQRREREGCTSCGYISGDFKINGKLTDYPGNFPVEAKVSHLEAEKKGEV